MKNTILVLFTVLLLVSCKKSANKLDIILSKSDFVDSAYINIDFLCVQSEDSVFFKAIGHKRFKFRDTISLSDLPNGDYELAYNDMIGERIKKKFSLKGSEQKIVKIVFDSIGSDKFYSKIPFNNLKNAESYTIEGDGGCVGTMHYQYKIEKNNDGYYLERLRVPKRLLKPEEVKAVQKFESELLAIENKDLCMSTGRFTYKIISKGTEHTITDNTCNWNGLENLMHRLR